MSRHPCLSTIGQSVAPRYLPLTSLVILYTCLCSPLLAPSSVWFAKSSLLARLSACVTFLAVHSTSQYCCLSISLSASWSGAHEFLLQSSPALDGLPAICCDSLLPLVLSAFQAGFTGLCIGYCDLLSHGVDVARAGRCTFSTSASAWNLFFRWRVKAPFALGFLSFFTANCCSVALPGPFPLSFSFRVAVSRRWSLPT